MFVQRKIVAALAMAALVASCAKVELENPENGTFTTAATVDVSGNVFSSQPDDFPVNLDNIELRINGDLVPVAPDGTYSTNILLDPLKVFNPIEADITDINSGIVDSDRTVVIAGESIADGDYSPESIALQINASGLDALEPVVAGQVNFDLPSLMPVGTLVIDDLCVIDVPLIGCQGRVDISIANPPPSMSGFGLNFSSQQNSVEATISLFDFDLNLFIDGGSWILVPDCDLNLMASTVTISGDFSLEPDAGTPTKIDVAQVGGVSTSFSNFQETFGGTCDTFLIGDIIQLIIGDVEPIVRNGLEGFLNSVDGNGNTVIADAIETALAGVDISGPVGQALNADLDAPFFQVQETSGGITLGSDSRFLTNIGTGPGECSPPVGAPDLDASYHVTQAFPSFGANTPGGTPYDIGLGISSSGFNQLLRSMVECGLLVTSITELDIFGTGTPLPLTSGLLAAFIPGADVRGPNEAARLEVRPTVAPLITGAPGPGGELALLKIAQVNIQVIITNANTGEDQVMAEVMLDADLGIDLSFDSGTGTLVFELSEPNPSFVTVKAIEHIFGADLSNVENLLPQVVSSFIPDLAGGLGSFPIPSFLGLNLSVIEVARNGEMLTLYADLQ